MYAPEAVPIWPWQWPQFPTVPDFKYEVKTCVQVGAVVPCAPLEPELEELDDDVDEPLLLPPEEEPPLDVLPLDVLPLEVLPLDEPPDDEPPLEEPPLDELDLPPEEEPCAPPSSPLPLPVPSVGPCGSDDPP